MATKESGNVEQQHVLTNHESMEHVELPRLSEEDEKAARRRNENRWKLIGALAVMALVAGVQLRMECAADEECSYILLHAVERLWGKIAECLWLVCSAYVDALLWLVAILGRG